MADTSKKYGQTLEYRLATAIVAHIGLSDPGIGLHAGKAKNFICDTLTRPPFVDELLGHCFYANAQSADTAAERFFTAVLERPIALVRNAAAAKTHQLLTLRMALMSGRPAWGDASLPEPPTEPPTENTSAENTSANAPEPSSVVPFDPALRLLGVRLRALTAARGAGPTATVGATKLPLPSALSVWEALILPPVGLFVPETTAERAKFVFILTVALEGADRHWRELVRAGLVPPNDWLEATSVNTLRKLNRFRVLAGPEPTEGTLAAAWSASPVPGFKNYEEVLESPLWRRSVHQGWRSGAFGVDDPGRAKGAFIPIEEAEERPPPEAHSDDAMREKFDILLQDGVIDDVEHGLFVGVLAGRSLQQLAKDPAVKARLAESGESIETYVKKLGVRVAEHAAARDDGFYTGEESGDDE